MEISPRLRLVIRVFVGLVFSVYGIVKIFGGQFYYGDWSMTRATVDGPGFVWAFYGYSPYYGRFIGFAELVPALLLFRARTATIGAAMLFPVALNITVMDFFYHFPAVKWMVLLYTGLLGVLLYADRAKLLFLLEPTESIQAYRAAVPHLPAPVAPRPLSRSARQLAYGVLALFLVFLANLVGTALVPGPEASAQAAVVARPDAPTTLHLVRSRYTGLYGINRRAEVVLAGGADGADTVVVTAHRASGFTPWRIDSIGRRPPNALPSRR
ncbi:MAG: hypothetical protein U0132_08105 [Gemmatimonadaceae bacterium]